MLPFQIPFPHLEHTFLKSGVRRILYLGCRLDNHWLIKAALSQDLSVCLSHLLKWFLDFLLIVVVLISLLRVFLLLLGAVVVVRVGVVLGFFVGFRFLLPESFHRI